MPTAATMMTTTMAAMTTGTTTETTTGDRQSHGRRGGDRSRACSRGARTRILAAFVILLAFSTLLSVLAIRQLLIVRTADRVDAALTQEVDEFRTLVRGRDPRTGGLFRGA